MADDMTIEDKIFVKQIMDEYNYLCFNSNDLSRSIARRVPAAAMKGAELKELSVIMRSNMMSGSTNIYKLFTAYKTKMKPNATLKEIASELYNIHSNPSKDDPRNHAYISEPLSKAVSGVNMMLRIINCQIEFIRSTYKVVDATDERFNKASVKTVLNENEKLCLYDNSYWTELETIEKELEAKEVDPYSPEYGKLIIKRLNSFKADVISAFNKYYGKNSVFAEFELSDMIR